MRRELREEDEVWQEVDLRPPPLVAVDMQGDTDSFASADDVGVLSLAFDDAIDNLTSLSNDNFANRPISRFISQMSAGGPAAVEMVGAGAVSAVGTAR